MRIIRSFEDVQQVLRDIENSINEFKAKTWDLNQRRITNVHPSKDDYDVVVRKELPKESNAGIASQDRNVSSAVDYDICVFGVGINQNVIVGDKVCPYYISPFNGMFIKCFAIASSPPTGSDLIFSITRLHEGVEDTIVTFNMLDGNEEVQTKSDFLIANIYEGDVLNLNITQIGVTNPGSMVVIKLKIKRT